MTQQNWVMRLLVTPWSLVKGAGRRMVVGRRTRQSVKCKYYGEVVDEIECGNEP